MGCLPPKILGLLTVVSQKFQIRRVFFDVRFGFYAKRQCELMYHKPYVPTFFETPLLPSRITRLLMGTGRGFGAQITFKKDFTPQIWNVRLKLRRNRLVTRRHADCDSTFSIENSQNFKTYVFRS